MLCPINLALVGWIHDLVCKQNGLTNVQSFSKENQIDHTLVKIYLSSSLPEAVINTYPGIIIHTQKKQERVENWKKVKPNDIIRLHSSSLS